MAPIVAIAAFFPAQVFWFLLHYRTFGDPRYFTPLVVMSAVFTLVIIARHQRVAVVVPLLALSLVGWLSAGLILGDARASAVTGEPFVVRSLLGQSTEGVRGAMPVHSWREFATELDRLIGPTDVLVLDSARSQPYHFFSDKPTQIATDRDKDSERLLARATPNYTIALLGLDDTANPNGAPQQTVAIADLLNRAPAGKQWVQQQSGRLAELSKELQQQVWRLEDKATDSATPAPTPTPKPAAPANTVTPDPPSGQDN
jgi:hypothetical protein